MWDPCDVEVLQIRFWQSAVGVITKMQKQLVEMEREDVLVVGDEQSVGDTLRNLEVHTSL